MNECDECGQEGGGHKAWHWRALQVAQAEQDCPPVVIDPDKDYGDPPF